MRTPSAPEPEADDRLESPDAEKADAAVLDAERPDEAVPDTDAPGRRPGRIRRLLAHRSVKVVLGVLAVCLAWLAWSLGGALTAPGNDSVAARVAEWGRDHHLGPVVTLLESAEYKAHPPKVGGQPDMALKPSAGAVAAASPALPPITPPRLITPAGTPLAGEGNWQVLADVRGTPALMGAFVRPDNEHTSYVAAAVSMDQRLVRFGLHPGESDPGAGSWGVPPYIPPGSREGLLATFNGGFKVGNNEARGGFYLNGVTHGTLTQDAASLVFFRDGHTTVGAWGSEVGMTSDVVGVRQNLKLIVDHGRVPDSVDTNVESGWGLTIAGKYFVWRSGVGITADHRLVYVYGPALSVRTLADLLQRAGCTEAMQLDINPAWMSYQYYKPLPDPKNPVPVKLLPDQERPAGRYYEPTSRDFTAVYAK
ncbi:phosphodiester glycosidase family protein [Streptacidiphilus sp. EB129]|uniref:phosphodiester glycosidase family protein n=1 Tax=Streptacidiphilus sp. EB129 TaxID=3156262 RepID=UPI003510F12B